MPDDSNGIYSVPAGTIVTTGDTILPSQHNPWANDSASAISARFSKDGRAPATGNWNINGFRLTNVGAPVAGGDAVNKTYADGLGADKLDILQPSVDVASATTTDIGAAASQNVRVTGTTTITSLGTVAAGTFRRVRFAGILTLTHNGTSLILPGAASITTAAGDIAEFMSEGSGNWRCLGYTRASLSPGGVFTSEYISANQTITSAGTLTLTHGLGASPKLVQCELECTSATAGYSIGDIIPMSVPTQSTVNATSGANGAGLSMRTTSTQILIKYGSAANVFQLIDPSTGLAVSVANSSFVLRFRAFR